MINKFLERFNMKKRILVISPHPDDETLGLGGSISKMINQGHEVYILTVSGHLPPSRSPNELALELGRELQRWREMAAEIEKKEAEFHAMAPAPLSQQDP